MKYLLKSLLKTIPVLLLITMIVFVLMRLTGDPVSLMLPETATAEERETLRESLGLNDPLPVQYLAFLGDLVKGDFGDSFRYNMDALDLVL